MQRCVLLFVVSLGTWGLTPMALAHDGLDERVERLGNQLEESGPRADLFLKRAEVHRQLEHWEHAFEDLIHAGKADPDHEDLELARARLLLDVGWWPAARASLERHIQARGEDAESLTLLAECARGLGDTRQELALRTRSLALHTQPAPEHYLQLVKAQLTAAPTDSMTEASSSIEAALDTLDAGILQLGPVPALQLRAIELERAAARWDAALARLETLTNIAPRKEHWLKQTGDLLAEAGRHARAREAWLAARAALDTLKPHRRMNAQAQALEAQLSAALAAPAPVAPAPVAPAPTGSALPARDTP